MRSLLDVIRADEEIAAFLDWPGDFDLNRAEHVEEVHLASGDALEPFAGDGAGGTYFFCGAPAPGAPGTGVTAVTGTGAPGTATGDAAKAGEDRPILYADSEGGAALIAIGVPELLRLLLTAPWWRDAQSHSPEELAAEYHDDIPDLEKRRDETAQKLGLDLPPVEHVLDRLREVATGPGQEYVLIYTPENTPYRRLIEEA